MINIFRKISLKVLKYQKHKNDLSMNSSAAEDTKIDPSSVVLNSKIGKFSYISPNVIIDTCKIGKYCSIGPGTIIGFGEHPTDHMSTSPMFYYNAPIFRVTFAIETTFEHHKEVIINNDVWIGANVYIKNGVTIGHGAIIAAGAVVVKDVPNYAIYGGVPAKLIKFRFTDDIIRELIDINWWDLDEILLKRIAPFFNKKLTLSDIKKLKESL